MDVVIYNRISTDDKAQVRDSSIPRLKAYCKLHEHNIIDIIIDEGVSGDTYYYKRPEGIKIDNYIKQYKEKKEPLGLVVFSVDRFSRQDPIKILPLLDSLRKEGVVFISVTEPVFNMEGEFAQPMQYLLTWFANYFLSQHKRKVSAGMERARMYGTKSGKPIGRKRKINYKKIIELYLQKKPKLTRSQIAKTLNCSRSSVGHAINIYHKSLEKPSKTN